MRPKRFYPGIRFKFLSGISILLLTFFFCTIYTWYSNLSDEAATTSADNIMSMMKTSDNNLEITLKDIDNVVTLLSVDTNTAVSSYIGSLMSRENSLSQKDFFSYKLAIQDFMISLCNFKHYLNGVTVSSLNGTTVTYGIVPAYNDIRQQPWYHEIISYTDTPLFIPPHNENPWLQSDGNQVLSIARPVVRGSKVTGFVLADIKQDILTDMFNINSQSNTSIYVLDNDSNDFIFKSDSISPRLTIKESDLSKLYPELKDSEGRFFTTINHTEMLIVYYKSSFTGWTIMGAIPTSTIMDSFLRVRTKVLVISILFFLVTMIVIFVMISMLTKNLLQLNHSLKKVDKDHLDISVTITSHDEIGQLYSQFNQMVIRIKELISDIEAKEREKRLAEMKALQYQINPHFLYNTLNTIKFLSVLQGADNIKNVAEALSVLLHISLDSRNYISVLEEVEYLESYLMIQEYRYNDKFTQDIIIEDHVDDYMLPKLLVQPIVENSLIHGISPSKSIGVITVKFYKEDDLLKVRVKDTGIGMSDQKINSVLEDVNVSEHIGISNVNKRIKLYFGENYGISILSEEDLYTIVEFSIPLIAKEEVGKNA